MNVSDWRRFRLLLISGAAVVAVAVGLLATLYVVRDGDGAVVATSGDPATPVTGELGEVLEPEDVLVESFGDGWVKQDEWYVEPSVDATTRTCPAFDDLLSIDDRGGTVATWSNGASRLAQQVADFGFDAQAYVKTARDLPQACPVVEIEGTEVGVSRPELDVGVAYELTAYPVADPATAGGMPEFDAGSQAWVITLGRANVVSVLTIEAGGELQPDDAEKLASIAGRALDAAEPEATGPFREPEGPAPQTPGTVPDVILTFDNVDCRNSGSVLVGADEWELVDAVPLDWRDRGPQHGDLTIVDDQNAVFVAHDGVELRVTVGAHPDECIGWDDDE